MYINSEKELRTIYGTPTGRAREKELYCLEKHSINFIRNSPFVIISSYAETGMADASPRGGEKGFVTVLSKSCIIIPDGKGNNRLDSLVNIIDTGYIGCLFLIPGIDETLRVNGVAKISTDAAYLQAFSHLKNPPLSCIEVDIKEVFLHCAKALMRAQLWSTESSTERSSIPTMSRMINDQTGSPDAQEESQEDMIKRYLTDL